MAHINPQIAKMLNLKIGELGTVIVTFGDVVGQKLRDHLKQNETGETRWVSSPTVDGKKLPAESPDEVVGGVFADLGGKTDPIVYDIYNTHEEQYLLYKAAMAGAVNEYNDAEKWTREFNKDASRLYRKDREESFYALKLNTDGAIEDARRNAYNLVMKGIHENKNPDEMIRDLRENVFGLKPGERNKGLTYKAERIVRTELAYGEGKVEAEILKRNTDILGVRIRYYGGPCPNHLCLDVLEGGRNFHNQGMDAVADFYYADGAIQMPPYHPNCYCAVARYLYEDDWAKEAA